MSSVSNVGRTAFDALKAKCSASITGFRFFSLYGSDECADHDSHDIESTYRDLLSDMVDCVQPSVARLTHQTPLVNAGYAMRVSMILNTIYKFICYHQAIGERSLSCEHQRESGRHSTIELQIVILGAGLDVTGIWSTILPEQLKKGNDGLPITLRVIEVDTPEICRVKKAALSKLNNEMIQVNGTPESGQTLSGLVVSARSSVTKSNVHASEYLLLELDLADSLARLERVLSCWVVMDVPTLVLSELVLSYLEGTQVDRLLQFIGTKYIQRVGTSAILAFEPLGPYRFGSDSSYNPPEGIVQTFRGAYCRHFNAKLDRGTVQGRGPSIEFREDNVTLHPLGSSCAQVEMRMRHLGFGVVHAAIAGVAIHSTSAGQWRSLELFDEHAALTLHLRSYVAVCAYGNGSSSLFHQTLSPWISGGCPPVIRLLSVEGGKRRTWIATLERHGEPSIRRIFSESYRDLADSHTSIRKMVRSALTSDLALSLPTAKSSCIHSYYKARGGFFLVALCPGNDDDTSDHPQKVLGGIGVRRMGFDELKSRAFPYDTSVTFEIHRLVVDYSCRRHGIGSMLLGRAKELIHSSLLCYVDSSFQLVATSPALIESANAFYVANDFSLMTSVKVGKMRMNTYIARCS